MISISEAIDKLDIKINKVSHNWDTLEFITGGSLNGIELKTSHENLQPIWEIKEYLEDELVFNLIRNKQSGNRITKVDKFNLLGISNIDLNNNRCILTEGVSDYFSTKILFPDENVLGLTTLRGSYLSKCIYLNLFDEFIIMSDNDMGKLRNTGVSSSFKLRSDMVKLNKKCDIIIPETPHKDITDNLIKALLFK